MKWIGKPGRPKDDGSRCWCSAVSGLVLICVAVLVGSSSFLRGRQGLQRLIGPENLFPAAGARSTCPDTPLRIIFDTPPTLGPRGRVRVFDAADDRLVDSIEVSSGPTTKKIGGLDNFKYHPIIISGAEASIFLKNDALAYNKTYYVTVDAGVFKDGPDSYAGIAVFRRPQERLLSAGRPGVCALCLSQ